MYSNQGAHLHYTRLSITDHEERKYFTIAYSIV